LSRVVSFRSSVDFPSPSSLHDTVQLHRLTTSTSQARPRFPTLIVWRKPGVLGRRKHQQLTQITIEMTFLTTLHLSLFSLLTPLVTNPPPIKTRKSHVFERVPSSLDASASQATPSFLLSPPSLPPNRHSTLSTFDSKTFNNTPNVRSLSLSLSLL